MSIVTQSPKVADCNVEHLLHVIHWVAKTVPMYIDAYSQENRMKGAKSVVSVVMLSMMACTGDKLEETQFRELFPTLTLTTESVDFETVVLYTETQDFKSSILGWRNSILPQSKWMAMMMVCIPIEPTEGVIEVNESQTITVSFEPGDVSRIRSKYCHLKQ